MHGRQTLGLLLLCSFVAIIYATSNNGRAISVFNIVKFKNDVCNGTNNKYGTCYTEDECEERNGKASGSCAEGYGVCCTFTLGCGDTSAENCTYFQSSKAASGACNVKLCQADSKVCQIRLDFETFKIEGPSESIVKDATLKAGLPLVAGDAANTNMGQCLKDTFAVSVPGGVSTPVICGDNKDQHMYIDLPTGCATLSLHLSETAAAMREWSIKSVQIPCDSETLAPKGCLQYFYGNGGEGDVVSFNFNGKLHLANQNQNACVRREKNMCKICWSHAAADFQVSKTPTPMQGQVGQKGACCGFGTDGAKKSTYDCVIIPGAIKNTADGKFITGADGGASEFCGEALGTIKEDGPAKTICSKVTPFRLRFLSDNYEALDDEAMKNNNGFKLHYKQSC